MPHSNQFTAPWRPAEIGYLKQLYPTAPKERVLSSLPNRTWRSIIAEAHELGVKRRKSPAGHCYVCGKELNDMNWFPSCKKKHDYICQSCKNEIVKKSRRDLRQEVLLHYSPELKCVKCGFSDVRALSIDHIEGGGYKHRASIHNKNFYEWLKKMNYPKGYQVLCMNCQFIKRIENHETHVGRVRPL